MRRLFAILAACFVALSCSFAWAQQPEAPETIPDAIVLGFNPAENAQTLQRSADEIAALLSERIRVPVRASVTLDYTTLVESMRAGRIVHDSPASELTDAAVDAIYGVEPRAEAAP